MKKEYESPVYHVRRVPVEKVRANSYNPNHVAPPEMKLLELSIWEDGCLRTRRRLSPLLRSQDFQTGIRTRKRIIAGGGY